MTSFKFGSTELTSIGVVTLINDYLDTPERRGDNQLIPFKHGKVFASKYYDERTLTFGIAIAAASAAALETAIETAKAALGVRNEATLEMTLEDTSKRTLQCSANRPLQINRMSANVAKLIIEFVASNPIWRSDTAIADNTTIINASPKAMTVTNTGTIEERDPTITIDGPFSSMTITNSTNGATLTYTGAIGAAETVTIGTLNGEFYATLSTGSANVIGNVDHTGSSALLPLDVGNNTLSIVSAGGDNTGTVKISFYPPFL